MDHTMVLGYNYSNQNRRQQRTDVTLSPAILIAMAVHRSDTKCITQCSMFRATMEAIGCCHWATTCSISLPRLPWWQTTNNDENYTPFLLAILMTIAMRQNDNEHIAQWRRSTALLEATGRCNWASRCSDITNWTCLHLFFVMFSFINSLKKGSSWHLGPYYQKGYATSKWWEALK